MAAPRSPNYPQTSLVQALADIKKVADEEDRAKVSPQAIAVHLGYTSLNGSAPVALSVLKKYGLLDGRGEKLWVSDTAYKILHAPKGSPERREALQRAALASALFAELRKEFPDSIPSQEAIRFHLIQKQFNVDAAEKAAKAYRTTMALVTGVDNGHNEAEESDETDPESTDMQGQEKPGGRPEEGGRSGVTGVPTLPTPGVMQDVFSLTEGQAVLRWPETLSSESFQDFKAWLELVVRKVGRAAGVAPATPPAAKG